MKLLRKHTGGYGRVPARDNSSLSMDDYQGDEKMYKNKVCMMEEEKISIEEGKLRLTITMSSGGRKGKNQGQGLKMRLKHLFRSWCHLIR